MQIKESSSMLKGYQSENVSIKSTQIIIRQHRKVKLWKYCLTRISLADN